MIEKNELIFGTRAVIEAIEAGKDIDKILIKRGLQNELSHELFEALKGRLIPVQRVPSEKLNRLTTKNHQGVIAFTSAVTYQRVEDVVPMLYEEGKNPFFVMLDGVTDVRNFGAQDIYMIKKPEGGEFMIPVVAEFVIRVDEEKGIFVRLIDGMR